MNRIKKIALIALLLQIWVTDGYAQLQEQELKSVLIERFSRFMTWTEEPNDSTFMINVLGNKEMYEIISLTYKERKIKNLPVKVTFIDESTAKEASACHILYVGDCFSKELERYTYLCQAAGAMVIGHEKQCKKAGATLFFVTTDSRVIFSYDKEALDRNKVNISYKLLQLAQTDY